MTPSNLPLPLSNLNAIAANQASQLEFAFRSLQNATGGKGPLRTDFDVLAQKVILFERSYTLGANVKTLLTMLGGNKRKLIEHCESLPPTTTHTTLELGFISTEIIHRITQLEKNELSGKIKLSTKSAGLTFTTQGAVNGAEASLLIEVKLITEFKDIL